MVTTTTLLQILFVLFTLIIHRATSIPENDPIPLLSLRINPNQTTSSCQYTVEISTTCASASYTRDQIGLSFGDVYGNQVYVPRLDNPSSGAFERCSSDTFQINGPCTYDICYAYLMRTGPDGWAPGYVQIHSSYKTAPIKFTFNTFLPDAVWYGFNYCQGSSSGTYRPQIINCVPALLAAMMFLLMEWRFWFLTTRKETSARAISVLLFPYLS